MTNADAIAFVLSPLSRDFVDRVRRTRRDDFGREIKITVAAGGEPLRDQLRRAEPGERILLGSYQAVPRPSRFAEIGPVFVSADAPPVPPVADALPVGYFNRTFVLRAYDARDAIVASALVEPDHAAAEIRRLLAAPDVSHLHARFAGHGCFAARIERSGSAP